MSIQIRWWIVGNPGIITSNISEGTVSSALQKKITRKCTEIRHDYLQLTVNMKKSSINIAPNGRIPASAVLKYSIQHQIIPIITLSYFMLTTQNAISYSCINT